ncbi:MAG: hypothetical protein Q9227_004629 [Pyrenula ochraceoflavens]
MSHDHQHKNLLQRLLTLCLPKEDADEKSKEPEDAIPAKTLPVASNPPIALASEPPPFSEQVSTLPRPSPTLNPFTQSTPAHPVPTPPSVTPGSDLGAPPSPLESSQEHSFDTNGIPSNVPTNSNTPREPPPSFTADPSSLTYDDLVPLDDHSDPSDTTSAPPPSYTRFDPHPPGCNCPIHVRTSSSPTLIELFQSQSCAACPPVNNNILSLLNHSYDPNVLYLDWHVTYWDNESVAAEGGAGAGGEWKDVFGFEAANKRQWDYARRQGWAKLGTPCIVVNGVVGGIGVGMSDAGLKQIVKKGRKAGRTLDVEVQVDRNRENVTVSGKKGRKGSVLLVEFDARKLEVAVKAGENTGRRLIYVNNVKSVKVLGEWNGGEGDFRLGEVGGEGGLDEAERKGRKRVVLVQEGDGGAVVGVGRV